MCKALFLAVLAVFVTTLPVTAHPHVWITARSEVVFDLDHRVTGFRHAWTFDEAYSAFSVQGLDSHRDGKPDPDKLAELAKTNVESLADFNWFTNAKVNGSDAEFMPPSEYSQSFADGRLTLRFFLPLKSSARVKILAFHVDDPSFFVAFNLADGADAVTLRDPPTGCALNVHLPPKPAEEGVQLLADEIANALAGKGEVSAVREDYISRAVVACP